MQLARINSVKPLLLSLLLLLPLSVAGCGFLFIDSLPQQCSGGGETCTPICETFCDSTLCWDECYDDCWYDPPVCVDTVDVASTDETTTTTTTKTTDKTVTCEGSGCKDKGTEDDKKGGKQSDKGGKDPKENNRCYNDSDCNGKLICVSGLCEKPNTTRRGVAGLCQVCENSNDCFEKGAKCIQINYDPVRRVGEKICGRLCEINSDCPPSFECVKTSNDPNSTAQCIPTSQSTAAGNVRTCNSTPQLQCVRANDCSAGESCINNRCEAASSVECISNDECHGDELCRGQRCVKPPKRGTCTFNRDCNPGETCISSLCQRSSCRSEKDCSANQYCDKGTCRDIECHYSSDCAMGQICANALCVNSCRTNKECLNGSRCNSFHFCE